MSILTILGILAMFPSGLEEAGRTAHVDARRGSDEKGDGSPERPWKTLSFAASSMNEGDTCLIREGVYRETVRPKNRQVFQAFGEEKVVISGCAFVDTWRPWKDGILQARIDRPVRQVFLGKDRLPKARYPDDDGNMYNTDDWAKTSAERARPSKTGSGKVTFTEGLGGKSFTGGFFTGMNGRNPFQANMGWIVKTEGDTLHCDRTNLRWYKSRPGEFSGDGKGYITDHLNALTAEREWHWEKGVLYLIPPSGKTPGTGELEARVRIWGFDCSERTGVTIRGLTFRAASVKMAGSTRCVLEACELTDVSPWGRFFDRHENGDPEHYTYGAPEDGTSGIFVSGSENVIRRCRVARGWGALITVRGRNNTVENNIVEEANWQCREFSVNIVVNGEGHRILRNTLRKSTAMLIVMIDIDRVPTTAPVIKLNDCRDYGYIMKDGGSAAIYFNGNNDMEGADISYNFIADNRAWNQRVSCGIYLDDGGNNARVHHNVIVGTGLTRSGLFTHRGFKRVFVYNNTFWGQKQASWLSAVWEGTRETESMIFRNNLCGGAGFRPWGKAKGGATEDHNRTNVPATEFRDVEALDFRLSDAAAASLDAGVAIPGVKAVADGKPDLGAYERGVSWKAGADWGDAKAR